MALVKWLPVDLALLMLKSLPALTPTGLVSATIPSSSLHTGWRHCWQTLCLPSHLCDYGLQTYSFFECANCSLQNTPRPDTPPAAGSESTPEAAPAGLETISPKAAKERCQFSLRGTEKASPRGGMGILGYLFLKTKGNYHSARYAVVNANRGHRSYQSLML